MTKREFLAASVGAGLVLENSVAAFAQQAAAVALRTDAPRVPSRVAKTTKLFKSPPGYPNGIAVAPEGLWIAEQKLTGQRAASYRVPEPSNLSEAAWLVDWNGKLLKTVTTPSSNTSGLAYGGGFIWMCANAAPEGIFQLDMNSHLVSHRQIPLGPANDGGGCHGAFWHDGKLWLASLRLHGILRVDPVSWEPEFFIPFYEVPGRPRYHGIAWDEGTIWLITGNDSHNYAEGRAGLVRYEAATGKVLETAEFAPGSADPHGLAMHDGALISCDAGVHPNWPINDSPTTGWIFRIDLV
jgi:streptogramin lyase